MGAAGCPGPGRGVAEHGGERAGEGRPVHAGGVPGQAGIAFGGGGGDGTFSNPHWRLSAGINPKDITKNMCFWVRGSNMLGARVWTRFGTVSGPVFDTVSGLFFGPVLGPFL